MKVCLHERLNYVDIFHLIIRRRTKNVQNVYDLGGERRSKVKLVPTQKDERLKSNHESYVFVMETS